MKEVPPAKTTELEAVMRGLERESTHKLVLLYSGGADSVISVRNLRINDIFKSMEYY